MCDWSGSCCTMAKQLKGGYLLRHRNKSFRIFGKAWREEWVILYDNSSLVWYKDRERPSPEGGLLLKDSPELLAVGLWTLRIPTRPDLPDGCHTRQLMAFGTPGKEKVHWFLCKSEDEVNEWMTAISNVLPPPPTMSNKIDDVISTPSRLKKTEILNTGHHKSDCLLDYHLPKASSLGNGLMNAHQNGKSKSTTLATYHQRPLGSSKTTNKNGLANGHYHGSSGALSSSSLIDKRNDDLCSALTVSTALGNWGWGPGWGWSHNWWNHLSMSSSDYSHLRCNYGDHLGYNNGSVGGIGSDSNGYGHLDHGISSFGGSEFTENIDIGAGLDTDLLDSAGSAFDMCGDFGF